MGGKIGKGFVDFQRHLWAIEAGPEGEVEDAGRGGKVEVKGVVVATQLLVVKEETLTGWGDRPEFFDLSLEFLQEIQRSSKKRQSSITETVVHGKTLTSRLSALSGLLIVRVKGCEGSVFVEKSCEKKAISLSNSDNRV